jgi:hypothetical protein
VWRYELFSVFAGISSIVGVVLALCGTAGVTATVVLMVHLECSTDA